MLCHLLNIQATPRSGGGNGSSDSGCGGGGGCGGGCSGGGGCGGCGDGGRVMEVV